MMQIKKTIPQVSLFVLSLMGVASAQPYHWIQRISPVMPPPADGPSLVYDQARQVSVLFGGAAGDGHTTFGDTWGWDGTTWTLLYPADPLGITAPKSRGAHAMVYDDNRAVIVLFGGGGVPGNFADTWEWNGSSWTMVHPGGDGAPPPRTQHAMAYDSFRQRTVLFGGSGIGVHLSDTWEWDGNQWLQRSSTGPAGRAIHSMAYDSVRQTVVLFGGTTGSQILGDTWEWDGAEWNERQIIGPSNRRGAGMAFDTQREAVVLFGGNDIPSGNDGNFFNETWEWDGTTWFQRLPTGPMIPRDTCGLTFDNIRDVLVLFGGRRSGDQPISDTWELINEDSDGDGVPDADDGCPNDSGKIEPGQCGCGVADADSDQDGTADCRDGCPDDPDKIVTGICGCGASDADSDNDGTADCDDDCASDPTKTSPGICGCGADDAISFTGFLPPIGGADATGGSFADPLRAFKLGSTIPVKFAASQCGNPLLAGIHTLQAVKYSSVVDSDPPIDATPTDAATNGNQFRLTDGQWHFNLSTKTGFSTGTWKLIATLSDNSTHYAWVTIKK